MSTLIEWTDVTDNIIVVKGGGWWCRMISEGCTECYAARLNQSAFFAGNKLAYTGTAPELVLRREIMAGWARQTKARLHFVASMTDVMGDWVPMEWRIEMLDAMTAAPKQIFQILTKRADELLRTVNRWCEIRNRRHLPDNIWPGVSVENQRRADERMIELRAVKANYRWVSYEPALEPVNWKGWEFISWMVSGGESGPGARPSHPACHRGARDWCRAHGIAYFFKQWGEWLPLPVADHPVTITSVKVQGREFHRWHDFGDGWLAVRIGKKAAHRTLGDRTHEAFPDMEEIRSDHRAPQDFHPALSKRTLLITKI